MLKPGPLGGHDAAREESDVIYTAVLLGFVLTRAVLRQPFSFDAAHDADAADLARLKDVIDRVVALVAASDTPGARDCADIVSHGSSPEHKGVGDALVTGRRGGESLTPYARNQRMADQAALGIARFDYNSAEPGGEDYVGLYHGRGAYTGMIDDVVGHHTLMQPTIRRVVDDEARWMPERSGVWGLIGGRNRTLQPPFEASEYQNLSADPRVGMGPLRRTRGIVQYVHGMSWAMREAIRWGPWTTAYELAVGKDTKKRASCFACTTYMYAAGFPASSSHLGRCESWGTLPDGSLGAGENHEFSEGAEGQLERSIARSINDRWHLEMFHMTRTGVDLLRNSKTMAQPHRAAADRLAARMSRMDVATAALGGKLFLDAITWHESDLDRVSRTLGIG